MPDTTDYWSGRVGSLGTPWIEAKGSLARAFGDIRRLKVRSETSHYHAAFTQGAVFLPRLVFSVEKQKSSPLGLPAGRVAVLSSRSNNEKAPWRDLKTMTGVVESEFVRPVLSGDSLLPYRASADVLAVVPCDAQHVLKDAGEIEMHPGLEQWWRHAEEIWEKNRSSERLSLFGTTRLSVEADETTPRPSTEGCV